jgi:hypothetical protein
MARRRPPATTAPDAVTLPAHLARPVAADWLGPADWADAAAEPDDEHAWSLLAVRARRRHREALRRWLDDHPGTPTPTPPAPTFRKDPTT